MKRCFFVTVVTIFFLGCSGSAGGGDDTDTGTDEQQGSDTGDSESNSEIDDTEDSESNSESEDTQTGSETVEDNCEGLQNSCDTADQTICAQDYSAVHICQTNDDGCLVWTDQTVCDTGEVCAQNGTDLECVVDGDAPTAEAVPVSGSVINKSSTQIVVTFSETMNPGTASLSGTLAISSNTLTWSDSDSVLTISPNDQWPEGNNQTLSIVANDYAGNAMIPLDLIYHLTSNIIYVNDSNTDTGTGTKADPFAVIQDGVDLAVTGNIVVVAAGSYEGSSFVTELSPAEPIVIIKEGVSIFGGYSEDFDSRDPKVNITTIKDLSDPADEFDDYENNKNATVYAGTGVTAATLIDGFNLIGGGVMAAALRCKDGASPTVQNNVISGGIGGDESSGIACEGSSAPTIQYNDIHGGTSSWSVGVSAVESSPIIQKNNLNGGDGNSSTAVNADSGADPIIDDNEIEPGTGINNSVGVWIGNDASATVTNNTINGGSGSGTGQYSGSYGVRGGWGSGGTVKNNTIDGGDGTHNWGVAFRGSSKTGEKPTVVIENNTITSGITATCTNSNGIYLLGVVATVKNNNVTVSCGLGTTADNDHDGSMGIYCNECEQSLFSENTVDGGDANTTYGMFFEGTSSLTIEKNTVYGGDSIARSLGIYTRNPQEVLLDQNTVDAGTSNGNTTGLSLTWGGPDVIATGNTVNGGIAQGSSQAVYNSESESTFKNNLLVGGEGINVSKGITIEQCSPIIYNNIIIAGTADSTYGIIEKGVTADRSTAVIRNNTIDGGNGTTAAFGITTDYWSKGFIDNNLIYTNHANGTCIYEDKAGEELDSFKNNNLFHCGAQTYVRKQGLTETHYTPTEANTLTFASGNINEEIFDYIDTDYKFDNTTGPLTLNDFTFDEVGLNGAHSTYAWGFDNDFDLITRSPTDDTAETGWSIGPFEY